MNTPTSLAGVWNQIGIGRVPLGRRVLFADGRRGALTIAGVAAALLLVLVVDAIFAGALARVTFYIRTSPADVFVSQAGVRTMHMSASALPTDTASRAASLPGVAWVSPIGYTPGAVGGPSGRQLAYVIGYDTGTGRGGPDMLVQGRAPGAGETVIDELAADQLGLAIGNTATVLGVPLRVSGLSSGGTSITNTTVYVSLKQYAAQRGPSTSYLLVGADRTVTPDVLASRLASALPGATAQTREQFTGSESRIVTDMSADLLALMSLIALLIALAVIALGLLTSTLARLHDYAVLKALGASTRRLAGTVASQVLWTVTLALAAATGLALLLATALPTIAPTVQLSVTAGSVARVGVAALIAGMIAAQLPLRRLATVDAATAFQESR
jgi:putative ABC transport system permease protein